MGFFGDNTFEGDLFGIDEPFGDSTSSMFGAPPTFKPSSDFDTEYAYIYVPYSMGCEMQLNAVKSIMPDINRLYKNNKYGHCIQLYKEDTKRLNEKAIEQKRLKIKVHLNKSKIFDTSREDAYDLACKAKLVDIKSDAEFCNYLHSILSYGGVCIHEGHGQRAFKKSKIQEFSGMIVLLYDTNIIKGMTFYFGDKACEYSWFSQ